MVNNCRFNVLFWSLSFCRSCLVCCKKQGMKSEDSAQKHACSSHRQELVQVLDDALVGTVDIQRFLQLFLLKLRTLLLRLELEPKLFGHALGLVMKSGRRFGHTGQFSHL